MPQLRITNGVNNMSIKKKNKKKQNKGSRNRAQNNALNVSRAPTSAESVKAFLKLAGSGALRGAGAGIGTFFGNPQMGYQMGANASKWLGLGAYRLVSNSLAKDYTNNVPFMHSANQSVIVRHREYLFDLVSSASANTFNVYNSIALNPGLGTSFPWLAIIAQNFQEYTWKGIGFEYISNSSMAIASTTNIAMGSVIMYTQYRATAAAPTSKLIALQEQYASDGKPQDNVCHLIECDPKENPYNVQYVRVGAVPSGEDAKTYDLGVTGFATAGFPGTSQVCGEIWVSYEVELRKPILSSGVLDSASGVAHYYDPTGAAVANPNGTGARVKNIDTIGLTLLNTGTLTWPSTYIPGAVYLVTWYWQGATALALNGATFTNLTNAPLIFNASVAGYMQGTASANGSGMMVTYIVTLNSQEGSTPAITVVPSTLTGATNVDILVVQIASNVL